jgi:2-polyprenyl-3-methyl-5-hydroxy-6-metoxy-1,4-benzoquinol methylase
MEFNLLETPDCLKNFAEGAVMLGDHMTEITGSVVGKKLLDIYCTSNAKQTFLRANMGAQFTAYDISPAAIKLARENAEKIGLTVAFDYRVRADPGPNRGRELRHRIRNLPVLV